MLIALDQFLFCVLSLGRYHPDITLSAQAYIWDITGKRSWPRRVIDALFFWQGGHCRLAYISERLRYV